MLSVLVLPPRPRSFFYVLELPGDAGDVTLAVAVTVTVIGGVVGGAAGLVVVAGLSERQAGEAPPH